MNYDKEAQKLETVINSLKLLLREVKETKKKSDKAFNIVGTPRQIGKAHFDLNWQCMALDKQRKSTCKTIVEADLIVSLEDCEYNPSGFHNYKHVVK